jgi:hypothetical protein
MARFFSFLTAAFFAPQAVKYLTRQATGAVQPLKVTVFGGTGYVGSAVCERLVQRGHTVTAVTKRGMNPRPDSEELSQVNWIEGDATDMKTVDMALKDADAAVHAIGLFFDSDSVLSSYKKFSSGEGANTRKTAFNVIKSIEKKQSYSIGNVISKESNRFPLAFVSAAEAGFPEVTLGKLVHSLTPGWMSEYLNDDRAIEARIEESIQKRGTIRTAIYRPSLIWDWSKVYILPMVPAFNLGSVLGLPLVDKSVRRETLADAIVAGLEGTDVQGVQRVADMEKLAERVR